MLFLVRGLNGSPFAQQKLFGVNVIVSGNWMIFQWRNGRFFEMIVIHRILNRLRVFFDSQFLRLLLRDLDGHVHHPKRQAFAMCV